MSTTVAPQPKLELTPLINPQHQILTVDELANLLKMSRQQIYEQTRHRSKVRNTHPLPCLRINGNLRFRLSDIYAWLDLLSAESAVQ